MEFDERERNSIQNTPWIPLRFWQRRPTKDVKGLLAEFAILKHPQQRKGPHNTSTEYDSLGIQESL